MISKLKVIDDVYFAEKKGYTSLIQTYELSEGKLPLNHELDLGDALYLVVGGNGVGKSTFLKGIGQSVRKYNSFTNRRSRDSKNLVTLTDWKRYFDLHNFQHFFNLPLFEENSFKKYQSKDEKMLVNRIARNVSRLNNSKVKDVLSDLGDKFGKSRIETLNRMAYIVESGVNIINNNYPQTLFQNYGLDIKGKDFDFVDNVDFSRAGIKKNRFDEDEHIEKYDGKNEGEKVMMAFEDLIGKNYNNPLYLLDEPTRSLSRENSLRIGSQIKDLKGQKFVATHDERLIDLLGKNFKFIAFNKNPVEVTNSY